MAVVDIDGSLSVAGEVYVTSLSIPLSQTWHLSSGCTRFDGRASIGSTAVSTIPLTVTGDASVSSSTTVQGAATATSKLSLTSFSNASPLNGDVWYDGTNLRLRKGGVSETIYTTDSTISASQIPSLTPSTHIATTLPLSAIPTVPVTKITGAFHYDRLPSMAASNITGTFSASLIPNLAASKFTGALPAARVPSMNASKITSGVLSVSRGGTGSGTLTNDAVVAGNGTGALVVSNVREVSTNVAVGGTTASAKLHVHVPLTTSGTLYNNTSGSRPIAFEVYKDIASQGWHRVAMNGTIGQTSGGNRAHAKFTVNTYISGRHRCSVFYAGVMFNQNPTIRILSSTWYSTGGITHARLVYGPLYGGCAVDLYADGIIDRVTVTVTENYSTSGFSPVDFTSGATVPSGYTSRSINLNGQENDGGHIQNHQGHNAVGTYAFMHCGSNGTWSPGNIYSASLLYYAMYWNGGSWRFHWEHSSVRPSGSWSTQGVTYQDGTWRAQTLMQRVL